MRPLLVDLTPLRISPPFRRIWLGASLLSGTATQLITVAVLLQVYELTRSTLHVGLIGLFAVVPLVLLGLYGGSVVDAHDRRRVLVLGTVGLLGVSVALTLLAGWGVGQVWPLYALVATRSGIAAVNDPARGSIVPRLLPTELLPAANALATVSAGASIIAGPLLAGLLIHWWGYAGAYASAGALLGVALVVLATLPPLRPAGSTRSPGLSAVYEGLRYLRTRPNLRMTFLVDLCAMGLAMPRALFPAIGATALGGGATTVGILMAAIASGSTAAGLLSGSLGQVRRQGAAVLVAVVGWGLAVAGFGLVVAVSPGPAAGGGAHWILWPAAVCLALAGAADAVSSVFRRTILQAATPDHLRGRLQGVFIVVVAGGPYLGDLVLGTAAHMAGEAAATIAGGMACVVAVVALAGWQPKLARYDAHAPSP